jgi:quinol monooxygenase YgiN
MNHQSMQIPVCPFKAKSAKTVTLVEAWVDPEALHAHLKTSHMGEYRKAVKDYVREVRLQVLTSV